LSQPTRIDGYLPIRDYAAIGDGRTVALVGRDGTIDWLSLPDLDSPSSFGALLDADRGGHFALAPTHPYTANRRYVPETNVLETTFTTADGRVQVTDAMTLPTRGLTPYRELVRRVQGLTGRVPLAWTFEPRLEYGAEQARISLRAGVPTVGRRRDALALLSWDAGEPIIGAESVSGRLDASEGGIGHLVLSAAHEEPLVFPARDDVEKRLRSTVESWREWSAERTYEGPWREAVVRSALALKLLVYAPSGAIAAAATTSLPEDVGGERNWDYRYSWPRDAAFTLRALLALGCDSEAQAFFSWLMHASQLTQPKVQVLYRLNGRSEVSETSLPLHGYRGSRPVRIGNAAARQTQLDVYGEVLDAAAELASFTGTLDRDQGKRLAKIADHVCRIWRLPDAGIWETRSAPAHYTQSKMMCFVALDRACALAERGLIEGNVDRWSGERAHVRQFIETRCYADHQASYKRSVEDVAPDAALLLGVIARYDEPNSSRLRGTVDAIRQELGAGPLVHRYLGDDGLPGEEGAFLACSFWLAEANARQGRTGEAGELMDELVGLANDVGLYAEQIEPESGDFLGNFPQGLSHLALINAAVAIAEASR